MEKGLLDKTGKSLEHWIKVVKSTGLEKHKAILDFLKSEHGFTHGFANFVSLKARAADAASHDADDLVEAQYAKKPALRPIYDRLLEIVKGFGNDITITPKKAGVSVIRKRQFALIKPATKTRMDLGLKLKGVAEEGKLGPSGPFGTMCTHRICLVSVEEIDDEVIEWLKQAYEMSV